MFQFRKICKSDLHKLIRSNFREALINSNKMVYEGNGFEISSVSIAVGLLFTLLFVALVQFLKRKKSSLVKTSSDVGLEVSCANSTKGKISNDIVPESVNYHFTRQCNYHCGFCFHTAKTSYILPLEQAKRGLQMLKEAGM